MSQAANDALKAAQDALRSFAEDIERGGNPEQRNAIAQKQLAQEAILIRGEITAMRILLAEALGKFMR